MNNKQLLLQKIDALYAAYHAGQIKTLTQHEVNPGHAKGSRENYLYFTLPPCLNFQRASPAMWQSALKTWNDPDTQYLFFPERVVATPLAKVQADLCRHKLALQLNKHTHIWITICQTLHTHFKDDPREILRAGAYDVAKIIPLIQKTHKAQFPYLSGPKMTNYWLYILSQFTDVKLANMHCISIIPDTHIIQCSAHLGLIDGDVPPEKVAAIWQDLLNGYHISPVEMHPVLWNWSRNGFLPAV